MNELNNLNSTTTMSQQSHQNSYTTKSIFTKYSNKINDNINQYTEVNNLYTDHKNNRSSSKLFDQINNMFQFNNLATNISYQQHSKAKNCFLTYISIFIIILSSIILIIIITLTLHSYALQLTHSNFFLLWHLLLC